MSYNNFKLNIFFKIKKLFQWIDSQWETYLILRDKELVKSIKRAEKNYENGNFTDWEDVKKELGIKL